MKKQETQIYWEKQGVDMLCGVHTINSLLQGPFYNQITLANIALQLDRKQKQLMQEQGMTKEFLKYMAEESGNVAMSGNYSIQVLVQALKQYHLQMLPIKTINKNQDLTKKQGFICNSQAHWFTIRKINGVWYNLNSTNKRLPQIISDFYLSAFLHSVQECGYQIFSVQGVYPQSNQQMFEQYNDNQQWYPALRILKYHQKRSKRKGYKPNISGAGDDKQMQKAIAASLGKKYQQEVSSGQDSDWDVPEDKKKKKQVKAFTGNGVSLFGGDDHYIDYDKFLFSAQQDYEIILSVKDSLQQYFKNQPKQGISVAFRYPNGKKQRRMFSQQTLISNLYDYIWLNRDPSVHFYLVNSQTKQKVLDMNIPLSILAPDRDITFFVTDL